MRLRAREVTKEIQTYDRELFAIERYGRIDIMRRGFKYTPYDVDGNTLMALEPNDHHVVSLTDTWNANGHAVNWGLEPIMRKIKSIDLHHRDIAEEVINAVEKHKASEDRALDNHLEAFWKDNRRAWAKNFDQVNRSNLDKKRDRRYEDEKKFKLKGQ